MHASWFEIGLAAAIATTVSTIVRYDVRRWRRSRHRRRGTGPYSPTRDVPRDVDLALAIAAHLRLKYQPIVNAARAFAALDEAFRVSLRAAAILAAALDRRESTT